MVIAVGIVADRRLVVFVEQCAATHPGAVRQAHGRPDACTAAPATYIPMKVNMAGVIPVIFASSLLYLPGAADPVPARPDRPAGRSGSQQQPGPRRRTRSTCSCYFVLIIFFRYFYVAITFNPDEVADNMKKYGGFIPGIRAGRPTAEYLDYVLTRITVPGLALPRRSSRSSRSSRHRAGRRGPELPLRRHLDPDHRRRRPRDREADRVAAAAAPLRRVPALMRLLVCSALPVRARAPRPHAWPRHSASRRSRPATSSAPTSPSGTPLGVKVQAIRRRGRLRARLGHQRHGPRPARPAGRARRASCSTATRATSPRWPSSTTCSADAGAAARPRGRADRRRARSSCQRLLKRAATEGRSDDTEDVIRNRLEDLRRRDRAAGRRSTPTAACWCRSTASARSTRSPTRLLAALDAAHAGADRELTGRHGDVGSKRTGTEDPRAGPG